MASQLKVLQNDKGKRKASGKSHQAVEELDFLITFNKSITQAMARTMQDLSEGVFINVANLTLTRRDSYLDYLKAGIKQDTLNALRSAPLHMSALFPDHLISKAEEEIRHHEDKPIKSESACLAPRTSAIKEQGFSEAVAARIEAPQRRSTRSVYEAKWTILLSGASVIRWTSGHHL